MNTIIRCCCIILIFIAFASCTNTIPCGTGTCPSSSGCCVWTPTGANQPINQCFDNNVFTCAPDQSVPGESCLCAKDQGCCNKACFNPASFECVPNLGNNGPTCLCQPGQGCCNGQCYDPNIFHCVLADNKPGKRCLCQLGVHDHCYYDYATEHQTCYRSDEPTCTSDKLPYVTVTNTGTGCSVPTTLACSATGSTAPFTYQWTASNGGTISGSANSQIISATTPGTYTCTVAGTNNCPASKSIDVTTSSLSTTISTNPGPNTCGGNIQLTCNPTGANGAVTYQWTTSGGVISGSPTAQTITATQTGVYTCTVTDCTPCTASASQSVTIENLSATVTPNPASSCGEKVTLTCNVNNANGPVSYSWTSSNGGTIYGATNGQTIKAQTSGTYTCTACDSSCTTSASGTVTIGTLDVCVTPETAKVCNGGTTTLTCNPSNANGPVTYQWTTSNGGVISGSTTSKSIVATHSGTYTCTATDSTCSKSDSSTVTVSNLGAIVTGDDCSCSGSNVKLTCAATNAVGPVTYQWTTTDGTISGSTTSSQIYATKAGTYKCTVKDSTYCTASDSKTITSRGNFNVYVYTKCDTSCKDPISLECKVSGTSGSVSYSWTTSGGGTIAGPTNTKYVSATTSGTYTCTVHDGPCSKSDSQTVKISQLKTTVTPDEAKTCRQPQTFTCSTTGAAGTVTYYWTKSLGSSFTGSPFGNSITAQCSGVYTCKASDSICTSSDSGKLDSDECGCTHFKIELDSKRDGCSSERTGAKAYLDFTFTQQGQDTKLTLLIKNTGVSSLLVGVAFDVPSSAPTPTYQSLSSTFTKFWNNPSLPPYGSFDIGVSPPRNTFSGGNPTSGVASGQQTTVQFTFPGANAATLAQSFYNGFDRDTLRSVGRFQSVNGNDSDKVKGKDVVCLVSRS